MKIYVCYTETPYEGCSEPLEVFKTYEAAERWRSSHEETGWMEYFFKELEVKDDSEESNA